jgi:MscS family membrane protein
MIEKTASGTRIRWTWYRPTLLLLALICLVAPVLLVADDEPPATDPGSGTPAAGAAPVGPHDDSVPRGAVRAYLDACREGDYAEAARYLRVPEHLAGTGETLARRLKVVLDRTLWVDLDALSTRPEGRADDGLSPGSDRVGVIDTSRGPRDIVVERVGEAPSQVWKFSASTVAAIPALYGEFGDGPLGEYLPAAFFEIAFLGIQLWQWMGLLILIALALAGGWALAAVAFAVASRVTSRTATTFDDEVVKASRRPASLALAVAVFHFGLVLLRLSIPVREGVAGLERTVVIVATIWFTLRLADVVADRARRNLVEQGRSAAAAVIPMGRKVGKAALVVLGFIALLQNVGFNVSGLLTGLGVGGIAIALAAQKSLENLFGGLMLVMDQPVRVGEFCRWSGNLGVVEEVGLRSTRIRTPDRTLISIPNSEFSNVQIENFAARDRIRLYIVLQLRYETTPDQMRHVLVGLRKLLVGHPRITDDPARVRFVNLGAYSLDVEVFAYVDTTDWAEFVQIREDVFLRMMDVVSESGSGFAFPSQTTYLARDSGLDDDARRAAEAQIESWRSEGELPFPVFSQESLEAERNTLDYPPHGSVSSDGSKEP